MPGPLFHLGVAVSLARLLRARKEEAALGSLLPDLDIPLGFLSGVGWSLHPSLTHSLLLSLVLLPFPSLAGGYLLHLFLDALSGPIPWAWPLDSPALDLLRLEVYPLLELLGAFLLWKEIQLGIPGSLGKGETHG